MRRSAVALLAVLALLASSAHAGTEVAPEVQDDPDDATGTAASTTGAAADVIAAWIDAEDQSTFNFVLRLGATPAPASGETFTYAMHVKVNGTAHAGVVTVTSGGAQASGVASGAFLSGSRLQMTLSRAKLGNPAPGGNLSELFVEADFESVLPVLTATDRAPDAGFGSNYTIGTLAGPGQDFDGDTLGDRSELGNGTDPANRDTDGDGIDDNVEPRNGTDPRKADTDADGLKDGEEAAHGTNPRVADSDADGALDGAEVALGTDPLKGDTDGDGLGDGDELAGGSDPRKADTDGDKLDDGREKVCGTSPTQADTDGDGTPDETECRKAGVTQSPKTTTSTSGTSLGNSTSGGGKKRSPGTELPALALAFAAAVAATRRRLA
jgi:hypothetical protein